MLLETITEIQQLNPWLLDPSCPILDFKNYIPRQQTATLLKPVFDKLLTILTGPRQAGKTTLGKYLCSKLLKEKRFSALVYLNCDYLSIRSNLKSPVFIQDIKQQFNLDDNFILFIDEAQRLENPGLLLKAIHDLQLPIKMIATGSSQLEIKSKIQEYMTGRHIEALILPLSELECGKNYSFEERVIFGSYPFILQTKEKAIFLKQLFTDYISKDIVEILHLGKPDIMQKLIALVAHSSGQLVNYNQLASDCNVSFTTIQNYLAILEKTYVVQAIRPFVGNKRSEVVANPIYYFLDNGFRNQALRNFNELAHRTDNGFLIENFIFQEILKWREQFFYDFNIFFWRTTSGAEIDFVLYKDSKHLIPVEAKYRSLKIAKISRSYRSFLEAYHPKLGIIITKDFLGKEIFINTKVHFIPVTRLMLMFPIVKTLLY